jgi:hypothetical protein
VGTWTSYPRFKVQSGVATVGGGAGSGLEITNVTIDAVDLARAFVVLSCHTSSSDLDPSRWVVSGRLTSTTNLRLEKGDDYRVVTVNWFVIESE